MGKPARCEGHLASEMILQGSIGPAQFVAGPEEPVVLWTASPPWPRGEPWEAGPGEPAAATPDMAPCMGHSCSVRGTVKGIKEVSETELLEGGLISRDDLAFFPTFTVCWCEMVIRGAEAELWQRTLGSSSAASPS